VESIALIFRKILEIIATAMYRFLQQVGSYANLKLPRFDGFFGLVDCNCQDY